MILRNTIVATALLLGIGCAADRSEELGGEGAVRFRIETSDAATRAETYDPMKELMVRIYKADGGLIRRYSSLDEMPEQLYLIAGDYDVRVEAGSGSSATWNEKSYRGEERFSVAARQSNSVAVSCPSVNTGVEVVLDASVIERFDQSLSVQVCAMDAFDAESADEVPSLRFDASTTDRIGYFILPEGVSNLSWSLTGEGTEAGSVERSGVIEQVQPATVYRLSFRYSQAPDGSLGISVQVDDTVEEHDDRFLFSPQPTIQGDGFSMGSTTGFVTGGTLRFVAASALELATVVLTEGERSYTLWDVSGTTPTPDGVTSERREDGSVAVTLDDAFFAPLSAGFHDWRFVATDTGGGQGDAELRVAVPGLVQTTASDCDLWTNTATLRAVVTDPTVSEVLFSYRTTDGTWQQTAGERQADGYTYAATVEPRWETGTNPNHTTYRLDNTTGIFAGRSYEYKVSVNGSESAPLRFETAAGPTIPDGDMENAGLSCFTTENQNAPFWASGNNSFAKSLCTQGTFPGTEGTYCARMASSAPVGVLAAGNLFSGVFYKDGLTTGVVEFGQPYDWTARPSALHLKYYAESLGTINVDKKNGAPLEEGDQDQARIFVAIVDWTARHRVTSGTSAPTGTWDPLNGPDAVSEGKIIAYGSCFIDAPSEGGTMLDITLPLEFYDRTTKPSGTYTLVISCAASAYGDYMTGCDSNVFCVDDFLWIF